MYRYSSASNQNSHRSDYPLSNDTIARYAPSVMAAEAHESRGERYTYIPTIQVIDGLRREGFEPFEVRQTKCRDLAKRDYTKHMVRMRHITSSHVVGTEVPEIILVNSHDGTSSYQLMAGFFRMVCSNGLIAGDISLDVRVRHTGKVVDDVIEGSFEVLSNLQELDSRKEAMKAITLAPAEQILLAESAIQTRWGDEAPVVPGSLIRARRFEDRAPTLWNTYNVIQENMLQGGVHGRSDSGRRMTTRAVAGVSENVKLNRALWSLAEKMAELKAA